MQRFFYDVDDRGRRVNDELGMDHAEIAQAMCDAVFLLKLLAIEGRFSTRPGVIRVTVRGAMMETAHEIVINGSDL